MCSATVQLTIQWRLPFGAREDDHPRPPEDSDDEDDGAPAPPEGGAPGPMGGMFPEIQARPLRPLAAVAGPWAVFIDQLQRSFFAAGNQYKPGLGA